MKKRTMLIAVCLALALLAAGCAAGANLAEDVPVSGGTLDGFWSGLWHGFISPFTFIISLFSDSVNIYEVHNNGGWYNFGFVFGCSIIFGGPARASKSKRN